LFVWPPPSSVGCQGIAHKSQVSVVQNTISCIPNTPSSQTIINFPYTLSLSYCLLTHFQRWSTSFRNPSQIALPHESCISLNLVPVNPSKSNTVTIQPLSPHRNVLQLWFRNDNKQFQLFLYYYNTTLTQFHSFESELTLLFYFPFKGLSRDTYHKHQHTSKDDLYNHPDPQTTSILPSLLNLLTSLALVHSLSRHASIN
jgi:hypothetical protein